MNIIPENCINCKSDNILQTNDGFAVCNLCGMMQEYQPFTYSYQDMQQIYIPTQYDRNKYLEKILLKYNVPYEYRDYVRAKFINMNRQYDDIKKQKNFFSYLYFIYRILKSIGCKYRYPKKLTKKYRDKYEDIYLQMMIINLFLK